MDFSKRLSRVAAIATWGGILLALVGAVVLRQRHDSGVHLHFYAFLGWQALAVLNALALSALPTLHGVSDHVRRRITTYRALLLLSIMATVTGAAAVSGGIRGPFWILYLPNILFAASTMRQWQSALLGGLGDLRRGCRKLFDRARRLRHCGGLLARRRRVLLGSREQLTGCGTDLLATGTDLRHE